MVDDDEKVTMIDFPQMVSVSHRNAEMYFDRDIECIFKFFRRRFNLSFHQNEVENDNSEVDSDEDCRPQFSDIKKVSGFLDRELEASGFTRKNQDDIEKFIDGGVEMGQSSGCDGGEGEGDTVNGMNETNLMNFESLRLYGKEGDDENEGNYDGTIMFQDTSKECSQIGHQPPEDRRVKHEDNAGDETQAGRAGISKEDEHIDNPELIKRLSKQRQRAVQAARGRRKEVTFRNTYKDKGGKSSHNSKIQKQLSSW